MDLCTPKKSLMFFIALIHRIQSSVHYTHFVATKDFILASAVLKTVTAGSAVSCVVKCANLDTCVSCNYYKNAPSGKGNCELNNRKALSTVMLTQHEGGAYYTYDKIEKDCNDVDGAGFATVYIDGFGEKNIYCDNGWVVVMRRYDSMMSFDRNWTAYKNGFGDPRAQFWIGNEALYALTNQGDYSLQVDMLSCNGNHYYVRRNAFRIQDENQKYGVAAIGVESYNTSSDAFLTEIVGWEFKTRDTDDSDCVSYFNAGWWYAYCARWSLTGNYPDCDADAGQVDQMKFASITGNNWDIGCLLQSATMKVRRNT